MPCMCGDYCCPSCGPAQGNFRCEICGEWMSEHETECTEADAEARLAREVEDFQTEEMFRKLR